MRIPSKLCAGVLPALCAATAVAADAYPSRPIRMIVAFAPGGGTDIIGRIAAQGIGEALKSQVIVDNRPGAGGNIGSELAARSAPDGYTLITTGTGTHAINPSLYAKIPYDAVKDFSPVSLVATTPYLMVVHPSLPTRSVKEFVALAKTRPGEINMASSGNGGMPHLAGELFQLMAGVKLVHIPYKGTGAVFADIIAGQVQVLFGDIVATSPYVTAGKLRALGITSPRRSPNLPQFAPIAEQGVPGYDAVGWFGVFAPAGTPASIIERLNVAIRDYVRRPDIEARLRSLGADVVASTPQAFAEQQRADLERWAKVIKAAHVRIE